VAGSGQRFNIGTGVSTTVRDLHTAIAKAVGAPDDPDFLPARLGDLRKSQLDSTRAAEVLGWRAQVGIDEGIERTVDYFRG
jgi:UDP-glucose 4-epimerase